MLPLGGEQVGNIILHRKEGAEKKQIIETSSRTFDLSDCQSSGEDVQN